MDTYLVCFSAIFRRIKARPFTTMKNIYFELARKYFKFFKNSDGVLIKPGTTKYLAANFTKMISILHYDLDYQHYVLALFDKETKHIEFHDSGSYLQTSQTKDNFEREIVPLAQHLLTIYSWSTEKSSLYEYTVEPNKEENWTYTLNYTRKLKKTE